MYSPTSAVANRPTHLTLQTQPIERPVKTSQSHQSSEKALEKTASVRVSALMEGRIETDERVLTRPVGCGS